MPCEVTLCMFSCLTFSKQMEINIVHGMWSYSLIELRHCRPFATVALSHAARVQQNWKPAEYSRSSSRRGHISLLCFIYTLSHIPSNHGHSPAGSVTSGWQYHICSRFFGQDPILRFFLYFVCGFSVDMLRKVLDHQLLLQYESHLPVACCFFFGQQTLQGETCACALLCSFC